MPAEKTNKTQTLSPREQEVIGLLSDGNTYKDTANKLSISIETVRKHASNIYKKLDVKNKTQAMMKVYLS